MKQDLCPVRKNRRADKVTILNNGRSQWQEQLS